MGRERGSGKTAPVPPPPPPPPSPPPPLSPPRRSLPGALLRLLDGAWLTGPRATALCLVLAAASLVSLAVLTARVVMPIHTQAAVAAFPDFAAFWASSALARAGEAAAAYDWAVQHAAQEQALGVRNPETRLPWWYPPHAFLVIWPLSFLPFWSAMAVWTLGTFALYLAVCWRVLPHPAVLFAAVAANPTVHALMLGQSGFLMAALLGVALLALERRPALAGLALAAMTIKPPLLLAVPVALLAGRQWRAIGWAAAGAAGLVALSLAAFGPGTWHAFAAASGSAVAVFEGGHGAGARWPAFLSVFGQLRHLGLGFGPALGLHAAVALACLLALAAVWRRADAPAALRAALLCYAIAVATPRIHVYDGQMLLLGALFQIAHARAAGFFPAERTVLAAALLADYVSDYVLPGPLPLVPHLLFWSAWAGHARRRKYQSREPDK